MKGCVVWSLLHPKLFELLKLEPDIDRRSDDLIGPFTIVPTL